MRTSLDHRQLLPIACWLLAQGCDPGLAAIADAGASDTAPSTDDAGAADAANVTDAVTSDAATGSDPFAEVQRVAEEVLVPLVGEDYAIVIERGDERLFELESGSFTTESVVSIGSGTKWLSAAVMLSAIEDPEIDLSLETRVGDVIPAFEEEGKGDLLVRQLFSMTSGLYSRSQRFETSRMLTLEQSVEAIARMTPVAFEPGTRIGYDGKGMQVAGRMLELRSSRTWIENAMDRLLVPCGMSATSYDAFAPNTAVAGGGRTSAEDYARYLRMLMRGGTCEGETVLSSASMDVLLTNHADGLEIFVPEDIQWPTDGTYYEDGRTHPEYALGAWVLSQGSDGSPNELASPGVFGAFPWINRRLGAQALIWVYSTDVSRYGALLTAEMAVIRAIRAALDEG